MTNDQLAKEFVERVVEIKRIGLRYRIYVGATAWSDEAERKDDLEYKLHWLRSALKEGLAYTLQQARAQERKENDQILSDMQVDSKAYQLGWKDCWEQFYKELFNSKIKSQIVENLIDIVPREPVRIDDE